MKYNLFMKMCLGTLSRKRIREIYNQRESETIKRIKNSLDIMLNSFLDTTPKNHFLANF